MKRYLLFLLAGIMILGCKKEDDPEPEPEPEKRGTIVVAVQTYDSLGVALADKSGVRVRLNTGETFTTSSNGEVRFQGFLYDEYVVDLFREGWEGPPTSVKLDAPEKSVTLPVAQRSRFQAKNLSGTSYAKDSITISFDIQPVIPQGTTVKVAVLGSSVTPVTDLSYGFTDIIEVQGNVTKLNIAKLPGLQAYVKALPENTPFYVTTLPVSYGRFQSNTFLRPLLLGENLLLPGYASLLKHWF